MQRTHLAFTLTLVACLAGCGKKSSSSSPGSDGGGSSGSGGGGSSPSGGSLSEAGVVAFNVKAISSSAAFKNGAAAQASTGAKAGHLGKELPRVAQASLALTSGSGSASENAGGYGFNSYDIAAGPPDAFQVSLVKVVLSVVNTTSNPPAYGQTASGSSASGLTCASGNDSSTTATLNASGSLATAGASGSVVTAIASGSTANGGGTALSASTEGGTPTLVLFDNPAGTVLNAASGTLDLGALSGTCGAFPVTPSANAYNQVTLTFLRGAKVSGCVSGNYANPGGGSPSITGAQTYCTRAGYSTFDGGSPQNADFQQSTTGELMSLDLAPGATSSSSAASPNDLVSISFPINPTLTISEAGQLVPLTIVMDLNRLLRFFNQNGGRTGIPQIAAGSSYFFASTFAQNTYAFVGAPGHIYGYDLVAQNCAIGNYSAAAGTCSGSTVAAGYTAGTSGGSNPWGSIGAWLTVVTDASGNPLVFNLMANDDNDLVLMKGSIAGITTAFTSGTATGTTNVSYGLNYGVPYGTIQGFPSDLGLAASGTGATAPVVGTTISGVTFDATVPAAVGSNTPGNENAGPIFVQVGLSD